MTTLDAILDAGQQQLMLDELLAEIEAENRVGSPLSGVAVVEKEPSAITAGVDPELRGDVSQPEIGTEPHNGLCPYTQRCEGRRRKLSTYREYQPCHWVAWRRWKDCPIYQNGGDGQ
jgi:hypothetical protein